MEVMFRYKILHTTCLHKVIICSLLLNIDKMKKLLLLLLTSTLLSCSSVLAQNCPVPILGNFYTTNVTQTSVDINYPNTNNYTLIVRYWSDSYPYMKQSRSNSNVVHLTNLTAGTRYTYEVNQMCSIYDYSNLTDTTSFTTLPSSISTIPPITITNVFPNPVSVGSIINITFNSLQYGTVSFRSFDILNPNINQYQGSLFCMPGINTYSVSINRSGTYIIALKLIGSTQVYISPRVQVN